MCLVCFGDFNFIHMPHERKGLDEASQARDWWSPLSLVCLSKSWVQWIPCYWEWDSLGFTPMGWLWVGWIASWFRLVSSWLRSLFYCAQVWFPTLSPETFHNNSFWLGNENFDGVVLESYGSIFVTRWRMCMLWDKVKPHKSSLKSWNKGLFKSEDFKV